MTRFSNIPLRIHILVGLPAALAAYFCVGKIYDFIASPLRKDLLGSLIKSRPTLPQGPWQDRINLSDTVTILSPIPLAPNKMSMVPAELKPLIVRETLLEGKALSTEIYASCIQFKSQPAGTLQSASDGAVSSIRARRPNVSIQSEITPLRLGPVPANEIHLSIREPGGGMGVMRILIFIHDHSIYQVMLMTDPSTPNLESSWLRIKDGVVINSSDRNPLPIQPPVDGLPPGMTPRRNGN
jgi:hypothetical protein